MKVLIDANLILTYITGREDRYSNEAEAIMTLCAEGEITGYISLHSLSIIWYVLRKNFPKELLLNWMKWLCQVLTVACTDNVTILRGLEKTGFKDFEDNLQDCCAVTVEADYIITANLRDFHGVSSIMAINPQDFLSMLNKRE